MITEYAILNAEGICINRVLWDGESTWQPPEGCTAVANPDNALPIYQEPRPEPPADPLANLTEEQTAALIALFQQQN